MSLSAAHRRAKARPASNGRVALRVAVYCRKSVEKGLDQSLTSLEAQRVLVERYVAGHEGWTALPDRYDDGGFSGKTTDRPAFQRLLADVRAGRLDIVAAYRIDRISRSQRDLLDIIAEFEQRGVRFVSVTEAFETATPQGRAMLGLLSVFAQLEREVTVERVTAKIHESRKRGHFTGGRPPLGLDIVGGKLVINEPEAAKVREMFRLFVATRSLTAVIAEAEARGWRGKSWTNKRGEPVGGGRLDVHALRNLLKNPLHCGCIRAGDEIVPAAHSAIVDRAIWDAAQVILARRERAPAKASGALLGGLLRCGVCGAAMSPHYAQKAGKRYASYVCQTLIRRGSKACPGSRVNAGGIEAAVLGQVRSLGQNREMLDATVAAAREQAATRDQDKAAELASLDARRQAMATKQARLVEAIEKGGDSAALTTKLATVEAELREIAGRADALRAVEQRPAPLVVDEAAIRAALAAFDGVWGALAGHEQARALRLLVEAVRYDGRVGNLEIDFHDAAIRLLAKETP